MSDWSIRREIVIHAPPEAVWPFIGTPAGLSRWWCPPPTVRLMFEPRVGGRFQEHYDDGEFAYDLEGSVVACAPPRRLAVRRLTEGSASPADLVDITLSAEGGATRVVIDHSFEDLPEGRRRDMEDVYAEGWSDALRILRDTVAGAGSSRRRPG